MPYGFGPKSCLPALPPDVRRGCAAPLALIADGGLRPRFGLCPLWAKGHTRGIAPSYFHISCRRGTAAPHIRRQSRKQYS